MRRSRIELQVDELVLHGVAPGDRHAVASAFVAELTRLLAQPGSSSQVHSDLSSASVDGGSFQVAANGSPASFGDSLARAVHASVQPMSAAPTSDSSTRRASTPNSGGQPSPQSRSSP